MIINLPYKNDFAFIFGRNSSTIPIGAIIGYGGATNLATSGSYSASNGKIECNLGKYAMGHIWCNNPTVTISYE